MPITKPLLSYKEGLIVDGVFRSSRLGLQRRGVIVKRQRVWLVWAVKKGDRGPTSRGDVDTKKASTGGKPASQGGGSIRGYGRVRECGEGWMRCVTWQSHPKCGAGAGGGRMNRGGGGWAQIKTGPRGSELAGFPATAGWLDPPAKQYLTSEQGPDNRAPPHPRGSK